MPTYIAEQNKDCFAILYIYVHNICTHTYSVCIICIYTIYIHTCMCIYMQIIMKHSLFYPCM